MLKYKGTHLSYVRTCTLLLLRRPAISETPYRRLPVFYFDYRHWWQYCRQLRKTYKQTSYFEMYAYNCNPRRSILGIYRLFNCV